MALSIYSRDIQKEMIASIDESMSPPSFRCPCNVTIYIDDKARDPHRDFSISVRVHPTLPPGNLAKLYTRNMDSMVRTQMQMSMNRFIDRMIRNG